MKFIQAKNYTKNTRGPRFIDWIVVHDMEMPEKPTTAEGCALFFHNQTKGNDGSSAHYCFDNNSGVQCVEDYDVAWAAPGANWKGIHLEHAGYAVQTHRQWDDAFSTAMLKESAKFAAKLAKKYGVPMGFVTADGLKKNRLGFTGHLQVTESGIGGAAGTHTDPGHNFPWHRYMRYVRAYAAGRIPQDFVKGEL